MKFMSMVLASHEGLHDNTSGLMQLEPKKIPTTTSPLTKGTPFVPVVPLAYSKYHPLLAVTTTVSLDVQELLT